MLLADRGYWYSSGEVVVKKKKECNFKPVTVALYLCFFIRKMEIK